MLEIDPQESSRRMLDRMKRYIESAESQRKLGDIVREASSPVFVVNLDSLRKTDLELLAGFTERPSSTLPEFERLLREALGPAVESRISSRVRLDFEGSFGAHSVTPRGLRARVLNKLVRVTGVVVSVSSVRSRLTRSTQYCPATRQFVSQDFGDDLALRAGDAEGGRGPPATADAGENPLVFELGLSRFKDVQWAQIQETPESVPPGLLSRSVDLLLQEDLVDSVKPGDRVEAVGVFRPIEPLGLSGLFRCGVVARSAAPILEAGEKAPSPEEIHNIRAVARRPDLISLLTRSLAPAIFGLEAVKEALLLQCAGGAEKNLPGGLRLRGDINVLLVGDPSTAKSQILRRAMGLAPLAFAATGRGSSGVGLTAAVCVDRETRERRLEAGSMVLADRGLLCLDEFDKMAEADRVAMHEAMEQQTVSLAKAGVHVSLNARCAVLAAANPAYGSYIPSLSHARNLALPESLLSRFDLIFVLLDTRDPERDRDLARRVTMNHRINPSKADPPSSSRAADPFLPLPEDRLPLLSPLFLKKFLMYVRARDPPTLIDESAQFLREHWGRLRQIDHELTTRKKLSHILPVTIRSLESLIRLATACAKLRLATQISIVDCARAVRLFLIAFYGAAENPHITEYFSEIRAICKDPVEPKKKRKTRNLPVEEALIPEPPRTASTRPLLERKLHSETKTEDLIETEEFKKTFISFVDVTSSKGGVVSFDDLWKYIKANETKGKKTGAFLKDKAQMEDIVLAFVRRNQAMIDGELIYKI